MNMVDELRESLLSMSKSVTEPPRGTSSRDAFEKQRFSLKSQTGELFTGFITRNNHFAENFSIGIMFHPKGEAPIQLCRVNGKHGQNKAIPHHDRPHVHMTYYDERNDVNRTDRVITDVTYITYEQAIQYFCTLVNIDEEDRNRHFPPPSGQMEFTFEE